MSKDRKCVALVQISKGFGGAEMRMAKFAITLAREGHVRPVLVVNVELAAAYASRPGLKSVFAELGIEIRHISRVRLALIGRELMWRDLPTGTRMTARRLAGRLALAVLPPSVLIAPLVRDVDVIHGFYNHISLAAVLSLSNSCRQTCLHEVTGHVDVPAYTQILRAGQKRAGTPVVLRCVSPTVLRDLETALTPDGVRRLKTLVNLTVNAGPFVGILRGPGSGVKARRIVFGHRLHPAKNGLLFAQAVVAALETGRFPGWTFHIFGRGPEKEAICEALGQHLKEGRVTIGWSDDLEQEVMSSAVFVSIITTGNYPSQSVLEALGHGNVLCLSDTGVTREKFGTCPGVTFYCDLSIASLTEALQSAVAHVETQGFEETQVQARQHFARLQAESGFVEECLALYGCD